MKIFMRKFWWKGQMLLWDLLIEAIFGGKFIAVEKNWLGFNYSMYQSILNYKSVHEGHSKLSNLGIILKGKCEP